MNRPRPDRSSRHAHDRGGMILIVVMIVVVIMSLAGFSFAAFLYTENKGVRLHGQELQLESAVDSGTEMIAAFLEQPHAMRDRAGGSFDNQDRFRGVAIGNPRSDESVAYVSAVVPEIDSETRPGRGLRFGLESESGRLNLAVLLEWERQRPGAGRKALLALPGMTPAIADACLDWIDSDSRPRESGAESDYYLGQDPPYSPRNGVPHAIEELLLVKGVTRTLLFGADVNRNGRIDAGESVSGEARRAGAAASSTSPDAAPWCNLLTLYSAERNETYDGKPRLDINDGDLPRLFRNLSAIAPPEVAKFVCLYRQYGPALQPGASTTVMPGQANLDFARPAAFRIAEILDLVGAVVLIPAPGQTAPTAVPSPIPADRAAERNMLPKLCDLLTTDARRIIPGRINVNLAPLPVLRGIPGLDEAAARQIVTARRVEVAGDSQLRRNAVWLLTEGIVDLARMKALGPYVTGSGGDVFRTQLIAFFDDKSSSGRAPKARVEVVIDAAQSPARIVSRSDLRSLGIGFEPGEFGRDPLRDRVAGDRVSSTPNSPSEAGGTKAKYRSPGL